MLGAHNYRVTGLFLYILSMQFYLTAVACLFGLTRCQCSAGAVYSRPEPLYFWFYFNIVNSVWIVVPALVMWYSASHINQHVAQTAVRKKAV